MDGTNHSRGSTIQSLSPDKREGLEHELRPEALASIAREENAGAWSVELVFARVTDGEKPRSHGSSVSYLEIKLGESPTRRRRAHPSVL